MSLWIKICGNTSLGDALLAVEAGADALGFVFAPSSRRVTAEQVAAFAHQLQAVETIGVFVDASVDEILRTVSVCNLTGVQLHGPYGADTAAELRLHLGLQKKILRVAHYGPDAAAQTAAFLADPNVNTVLIDSRSANALGGTGIAFNWNAARGTIFQDADAQQRIIVAGGLGPDNVAEAIAILRPAGIDVASGVEAVPGRKDPVKLRTFVERARAAATL